VKTKDSSSSNDNSAIKNNMTSQTLEKKKQLDARKKIENYIADKQLQKNIGDFGF